MNIINNFKNIAPLIDEVAGEDIFFTLYIMQHKKDGNEFNRLRKTYYIRNSKHLQEIMVEIVLLSELYHARAYINVTPRSYSDLQKASTLTMVQHSLDGTKSNPHTIIDSEAGKLKGRAPRWIIDVDDAAMHDDIDRWLTKNNIPHVFIPTKTHGHFVTQSRFNTSQFQTHFPTVDIKKNAMGTLLYMEY